MMHWCSRLPDLTLRFYAFYFLVLKVSFNVILMYYVLKLITLAVRGELNVPFITGLVKDQLWLCLGFMLVFICAALGFWLVNSPLSLPVLIRLSLCLW